MNTNVWSNNTISRNVSAIDWNNSTIGWNMSANGWKHSGVKTKNTQPALYSKFTPAGEDLLAPGDIREISLMNLHIRYATF